MGVSTDIVSQSLGHKDIKVTQNYLKDFEDEIIDEAIKKLLEEDIINYNKNLQ
jgi:integrase